MRTKIKERAYKRLIKIKGIPKGDIICDTKKVYVASGIRVEYLYKRMKGLVLVVLKKDCLDLPEKQYEIIRVVPTVEILQVARMIKQTAPRAIQALTLLRELSDGFQYGKNKIGMRECGHCFGKKTVSHSVPKEGIDPTANDYIMAPGDWIKEIIKCPSCGGTGEVAQYERVAETVPCPKDEVVIRELDTAEEYGRYIIWGGFRGTIDRLVSLVHQQGWTVLRIDGRGFYGIKPDSVMVSADMLLDCMDAGSPNRGELLSENPKVCVVGHPGSGGMALTLSASPVELFFSNTFNGEDRMQAEERFHRIGMDTNRGCTIKDIIHLPTDQLVLDNLKKKKRLQKLTMGELEEGMRL